MGVAGRACQTAAVQHVPATVPVEQWAFNRAPLYPPPPPPTHTPFAWVYFRSRRGPHRHFRRRGTMSVAWERAAWPERKVGAGESSNEKITTIVI